MRAILDHSIVGLDDEGFTLRKDREFAACRICGAIFQSWLNTTQVSDEEYAAFPEIALAASIETKEWRAKHNKKHPESEHLALRDSGRTMTPEAAIKLAPFGLVPIENHEDKEVAQALLEAPRAPANDVETTLRRSVLIPKEL